LSVTCDRTVVFSGFTGEWPLFVDSEKRVEHCSCACYECFILSLIHRGPYFSRIIEMSLPGIWHYSLISVEFESLSGEVYSIQLYVIKFVSDLQQVDGFFPDTPVSSTNKIWYHNITKILLKVALKTLILTHGNPLSRGY
jgi:hypothetical protein